MFNFNLVEAFVLQKYPIVFYFKIKLHILNNHLHKILNTINILYCQ